ncbi:hypothetical protein H0H93_002430, partial [Arthromyces matolae]
SCLTILAYDYLLTLGMEIEVIWTAKWGVGEVLFFLARYPTFINVIIKLAYYLVPNVSVDMCKGLSVAGVAIAEVIEERSRWHNNLADMFRRYKKQASCRRFLSRDGFRNWKQQLILTNRSDLEISY